MRLYQINTRLLLHQFSSDKKIAHIQDIPEEFWLNLVHLGFDTVWLMGVWKVRPDKYTKLGLEDTIYDHYNLVLPDITKDDLGGSLYAIDDYIIDQRIGTEQDFLFVKKRLNTLGLKVILDFIPNHFHQYSHLVYDTPEAFFPADTLISNGEHAHTYELPESGGKMLYHGKDPHFEPWNDTVQVNYFSESARDLMIEKLRYISTLSDGVRCDMTMLMLKDVFNETWSDRLLLEHEQPMEHEWWDQAIGTIKAQKPEFQFLAEVYWGLDDKLRELGFDITYDKEFYDALELSDLPHIKNAIQSKQTKHLLRFIENHDEPRAVSHFGLEKSQALAVLMLMVPGNILIQHGQMQGFLKRVPVQLIRNPEEKVEQSLVDLYTKLLMITKQDWFQKSSCVVIDIGVECVVGIVREYHERKMLALVNVSDKEQEVNVKSIFGSVESQLVRDRMTNRWMVEEVSDDKSMLFPKFGFKILEIVD